MSAEPRPVCDLLPALAGPIVWAAHFFAVYLAAVRARDRALVPPLFHRELDETAGGAVGDSHPSQVRLAVDIVAGFTDNQALGMHRRLLGVSPGSVTELLHG